MNRRFRIFFKFLTTHNKFRSFLFFFLISTLFWLLMQLSKNYEYTFKVPVTYVNLPDKYYKGFLPNDTLSVKMAISGFKILHYKLVKPSLTIDVQKSGLIQGKVWKVKAHLSQIRSEFDEISRILSVEPAQLSLHIKAVHKKQVPVEPLVIVNFKPGFKNKRDAEIKPDSIWLYGQPAILDTITQVETKAYRFKEVDKTIDKSLKIKHINGIKFNKTSVRYRLPVSEIIEDTISLPVQIKGKPAKVKVLLFPGKVKLKFKVFKETFKNIKSGDFRVEVVYRPELKYWVPKLVKRPVDVFDFNIQPDKITFLIKP